MTDPNMWTEYDELAKAEDAMKELQAEKAALEQWVELLENERLVLLGEIQRAKALAEETT